MDGACDGIDRAGMKSLGNGEAGEAATVHLFGRQLELCGSEFFRQYYS